MTFRNVGVCCAFASGLIVGAAGVTGGATGVVVRLDLRFLGVATFRISQFSANAHWRRRQHFLSLFLREGVQAAFPADLATLAPYRGHAL